MRRAHGMSDEVKISYVEQSGLDFSDPRLKGKMKSLREFAGFCSNNLSMLEQGRSVGIQFGATQEVIDYLNKGTPRERRCAANLALIGEKHD